MIQLDLFRTTERVELGVDCFDISKVDELKIDTHKEQRRKFVEKVELLRQLPSDTYIMYKTGAYHRDREKYPDPIYPYLFDMERKVEIPVSLTRTNYPTMAIPTRYLNLPKGSTFAFLVHRLAAHCFLANDEPNHKVTVDHIDGDKLNYTVNNLEWVSYSENNKRSSEQRKKAKNK